MMNDYGIKRKEIWILNLRKELIIYKIKLKGDESIDIQPKAKSRVFNVEMNFNSILDLLRRIKEEV